MPTKKTTFNKDRKGDTSRTSSQGRKLSTGGDLTKRGDQELDENSKAPVREMNEQKKQEKTERNRP